MRLPAHPRRRRALPAVLASALMLLMAGCASAAPADRGASPESQQGAQTETTEPNGSGTKAPFGAELSGSVTVFAAASLTDTFNQLANLFEQAHPGVSVKPVYDGSSTLLTQLTEGASADVFASADEATMNEAVKAGLIDGDPDVFTRNTLEIAVAPGNPRDIHRLSDLANEGLQVVLCAPQVPCGAASVTLLDDAGVHLTPASQEQNVKAVLTKVSLGEADAGLVYATDVKASGGDVEGIPIANANKAVNTYLIAVPASSTNTVAGRAFIDLVESAAGQKILTAAGFHER